MIEKHYQLKNILIKLDYIYRIKYVINNLKKSYTWKIQLAIFLKFFSSINFISSKDDNDQERLMHSKSENIEIMINDEVDEVMKESLDGLKAKFSVF